MSSETVRKKAQRIDYASTETTSHGPESGFCNVSTQTTLAGHRDPNEQQLLNPPRDAAAKRKKNLTERNRRRIRDKKKLPSTTSGVEDRLDNERRTASGTGDTDEHSDVDQMDSAVEESEESDDNGFTEKQSHEQTTLVRPTSTSTTSDLPESFVSSTPIDEDRSRKRLFLMAIQDVVRQPLEHLQQTREVINSQEDLIEELQAICENLNSAIGYLELAMNAIDAE